MNPKSWATTEAVRRSMQSNRSRDTKPELALRRALHACGLRFRVCASPLAGEGGTADIVFRSARVAVEVRGCFWHGCPDHYRKPVAHDAYWAEKIAGNITRDQAAARRLAAAGWILIVVWEHDDPIQMAAQIADVVRQRSSSPGAIIPARRA